MSSRSSYLFVYGTLRRASKHPMAHYLDRHARWLGPATVPGRLYDLGPYPGVLPAADAGDQVHGDLCEMNEPDAVLARLDEYEGCPLGQPEPGLFERALATVTTEAGDSLQAWLYYYRRPVREEQRIESGIYPLK
jgi:gamma-glutamylcyclotransferase (GGCT)/AIG2-like uncharacterized protein YtfP